MSEWRVRAARCDYDQRLMRRNDGPEGNEHAGAVFLVPGLNHFAGGPATDRDDVWRTVTTMRGERQSSQCEKIPVVRGVGAR